MILATRISPKQSTARSSVSGDPNQGHLTPGGLPGEAGSSDHDWNSETGRSHDWNSETGRSLYPGAPDPPQRQITGRAGSSGGPERRGSRRASRRRVGGGRAATLAEGAVARLHMDPAVVGQRAILHRQ